MRGMIVAVILTAIPGSTVVAQSDNTSDFPSRLMLLIQSELDYLEVATLKISVDFDKVEPKKALAQIGARAGLSIEVHGTLPKEPRLTRSFEDATVKEVLTWYAGAIPVAYKAEGPNKLTVFFRAENLHRDKGGAS